MCCARMDGLSSLANFNIHEEFLIKIDPNWVDFEKTSISTEVRVSADSYGLGDRGLGTGLVVRGAAVMKSTKTGY